MKKNPLISVIVPIYNVEKYIVKCVESIRNQTYENLEIILVDDGSPDNCPKICDELAVKDSRIRTVHRDNGGLSAARNSGLSIAKGEFIAFVDSDDYIDNDMIECLYKTIKENEADLAVCRARLVDENYCVIKTFKCTNEVSCYNDDEAYSQIIPTLNNSVWNKMFNKELIGELRFPEGRIHGEDFIFLLEYLKNVKKIAIIDAEKYNYLQRQGSITKSGFSGRKLDEIYSKDRIFEIISEFYPEYTDVAKKWQFNARMNVVRSITLSKAKKSWKDEYNLCLAYLKNNYKNVKKYLSKKEKTEYILQRYLRFIYPVVIKVALKK